MQLIQLIVRKKPLGFRRNVEFRSGSLEHTT